MPLESTALREGRKAAQIPVLVFCLLAFVVMAVVLAARRPPQADEGHFASAAAAIAFEGRFVMPMWTEWIPTLNERVYSNMPLYFITLAAWFKAFGVDFLTMRLFSVLWGVVLIGAGYVILRSLSGDGRVATLGVVLLAFNYDLVNFASARYDIMAAALNLAGVSAYLHYRVHNLGRAVLLGNVIVAAACLTHPYALFGMAGLLVFAIMLDRRRLRLQHLLIAASPYIVAGLAWGLYIIQDVDMFRAQFGTNASNRTDALANPLHAIYSEFRDRYVVAFGGWRAGGPGIARVKVLLLAFYGIGVAGCLLSPTIRSRVEYRALLAYLLVSAGLLTFLESTRWYIYMVYIIPLYALCTAIFLHDWLRRPGYRRHLAAAATAAFVLFCVFTLLFRAAINVHGVAFVPAVEYLQQHTSAGDLVMAGGEFGIGLGFAQHVLDDAQLGYANGRAPDFVVLSPVYAQRHARWARTRPEVHDHITRTLGEFETVFTSRAGHHWYEVLARRNPDSEQ
jgi:4-amino-4-deoxy-L-arabinose transferase-like glycosyltransferase